MDTILTKKYPVSKKEFIDIVVEKVTPIQQEFIGAISTLLTEIKTLCSERQSILMMGRNVYLDTKLKILLPDLHSFDGILFGDYFSGNQHRRGTDLRHAQLRHADPDVPDDAFDDLRDADDVRRVRKADLRGFERGKHDAKPREPRDAGCGWLDRF